MYTVCPRIRLITTYFKNIRYRIVQSAYTDNLWFKHIFVAISKIFKTCLKLWNGL